MDIKEIREKARLTDSEIQVARVNASFCGMSEREYHNHYIIASIEEVSIAIKAQDKLLNAELLGEECPACNGVGADMSFTLNPLEMPNGRDCPDCNGTGKVTVTVEQAIQAVIES